MELSYRIMVLIDHRSHGEHESLYPMLRYMRRHPRCVSIEVASRGNGENDALFYENKTLEVSAMQVSDDFYFDPAGTQFLHNTQRVNIATYDVVLLRLAKPNPVSLFSYLENHLGADRILNRPSGILLTGSKKYLLNFPELCPPMQLCYSVEEVIAFKSRFPIVLKPFDQAGGRGIIRIEGDQVWEQGNEAQTWEVFLPHLASRVLQGYLAMQFLPGVAQGDKRIIVVNGSITGAALRIPAPGAWLCNVNMGGHAVASEPDEDESAIAAVLAPALEKQGVIAFGFDTLMGNAGKRLLSEINTSNPGGMYPAEQLSGKAVVGPSVNLWWAYILTHISPRNTSRGTSYD